MSDLWDQTKFNDVLKEYLKWTKKSLAEVLNQKAYFIARKALWFTRKANAADIKSDLRRIGLSNARTTKSGRTVQTEGPRGALIINRKRGRLGEKGLYGSEMREAFDFLLYSRLRSIAFLKSGWIPAIRILDSFVKDKSGAAPSDRDAKVYGAEKGAAYPATDGGEQIIARVLNSAAGKTASSYKALDKWGGAALELAFHDEAGSMQDHIERKMNQDAARANAQL